MCEVSYILLTVLLTGEFMIRLKPQFINLVLDGSVDLDNRDMLKLTKHQVLCINDKSAFMLDDKLYHLLEIPIERSVRNAKINNVQVAMLKHLLHHFSALTIEHYSHLNRMFISRIRNGVYGKNIQPLRCTLKQFIDYAGDDIEAYKNDYKFTVKGVVGLLHKYNVPRESIASELNLKLSVVDKIIENN